MYSVIVLMIFGWSIRSFLWYLPSWIYYANLTEIGVFFAYMVVVNLVDTLLVLAVPLAMSLLLPVRWFHDRFVTKGTALILLGLGALMIYHDRLQADSLTSLLLSVLPATAVILALAFLADAVAILRRVLEELATRAVIFLYLSIPLGALSVLVVVIRNLA